MNTSEVTKKLGVSPSTVKRWIKQCNLDLERNELGHYIYSEKDLQILTDHKEKMILANSPTETSVKKEPRKGKVLLQKAIIQQLDEVNKEILTSSQNHSDHQKLDVANKGEISSQKNQENPSIEKLIEKVAIIESCLANKADSVVVYQVLQHRKEIEELENQISLLTERIAKLEAKKEPSFQTEARPLIDESNRKKQVKKRNLISMLFSL